MFIARARVPLLYRGVHCTESSQGLLRTGGWACPATAALRRGGVGIDGLPSVAGGRADASADWPQRDVKNYSERDVKNLPERVVKNPPERVVKN